MIGSVVLGMIIGAAQWVLGCSTALVVAVRAYKFG